MTGLRDYVDWHRGYATRETGSRPAVGAVRYSGPATPLVTGERLFTFVR